MNDGCRGTENLRTGSQRLDGSPRLNIVDTNFEKTANLAGEM